MSFNCLRALIVVLPVFVIATGLLALEFSQDATLIPDTIAQATSGFDNYMKLGYAATAKRDYRNALIQFRQAGRLRPGNRYAALAIQNISGYVSRGRSASPIFIPPNTGAPIARVGGATRSLDNCSSEQPCLIALLPNRSNGSLLTNADYPTLLFYLSRTTAQRLEFRLQRANDPKIYRVNLSPPQTGGIVSLSLSMLKDEKGNRLPPLASGQDYQWIVSLMLENLDRSQNPTIEGAIQRAALDPILVETLQKLPASDRIALYTANNIWYDAAATLYQERRTQANNAQLGKDWTALLETVGLGRFAQEPFLPCCTVRP